MPVPCKFLASYMAVPCQSHSSPTPVPCQFQTSSMLATPRCHCEIQFNLQQSKPLAKPIQPRGSVFYHSSVGILRSSCYTTRLSASHARLDRQNEILFSRRLRARNIKCANICKRVLRTLSFRTHPEPFNRRLGPKRRPSCSHIQLARLFLGFKQSCDSHVARATNAVPRSACPVHPG